MTRLLLSFLLALAVTACATVPPPTPISATAGVKSQGVATIAEFGTWDMETVPAITRHQVLLKRLTAMAEKGQITKPTATTVFETLGRAKAALEKADRGNNLDPTPANRAALIEAKRLLDIAESLMEARK